MKLLVKWFSEKQIDNKYIEKTIDERLILSDNIDISFKLIEDNRVDNLGIHAKINLFLDKSDIDFYIEKNDKDNSEVALLSILKQSFMTKDSIEIWLRLDNNNGLPVLDRVY